MRGTTGWYVLVVKTESNEVSDGWMDGWRIRREPVVPGMTAWRVNISTTDTRSQEPRRAENDRGWWCTGGENGVV